MSGHLFFGERWYGFDDATYTAARLLEILSRSDDASAVLDALPTSFSTPELNVPCAEGEHHAVVAELLARAADGRLASRAARSAPSTACAWTSPTASASSAPATRRRCWCCASRATRGRAAPHRGRLHGRAAQREARRAGGAGGALSPSSAAAQGACPAAGPSASPVNSRWRGLPTRRCCAWPRRCTWRGCGGAAAASPPTGMAWRRAPRAAGAVDAGPGGCGCMPCRWARRAPRRR